ncbi:unnamed protein product [Heterobilharzia americana]|nr:unnamed protein product [Heterobilharzia americana]
MNLLFFTTKEKYWLIISLVSSRTFKDLPVVSVTSYRWSLKVGVTTSKFYPCHNNLSRNQHIRSADSSGGYYTSKTIKFMSTKE